MHLFYVAVTLSITQGRNVPISNFHDEKIPPQGPCHVRAGHSAQPSAPVAPVAARTRARGYSHNLYFADEDPQKSLISCPNSPSCEVAGLPSTQVFLAPLGHLCKQVRKTNLVLEKLLSVRGWDAGEEKGRSTRSSLKPWRQSLSLSTFIRHLAFLYLL